MNHTQDSKPDVSSGQNEKRLVFDDNAKVFSDDLTPTEVAKYYSTWCSKYEKDFHIDGLYLGPSYVAETLGHIYTDRKDQVKVLDVACGTGILGEKLHNLGFRDIDGLDPTQNMLDICRDKHIYNRLICGFMTEQPTDINTDTYECLGVSGGFGPGHIPRGALRELIRIVKPGGAICLSIREEYLEMAEEYKNNKLDDAMTHLENIGLWKKVERRIVPNYFCNKPGVIFLYRVI